MVPGEQQTLTHSDSAQTSEVPARICYIDSSLRNDMGHFANSCRYIAGEFRRRQFTVDVYGHRSMSAALANELKAKPFFRHAAFDNIFAHRPISVLFRADYLLGRTSFLQDLKTIWSLGPYDFLYFNSVLPAQLAALAMWLPTLPEDEAPALVAEFGTPSGTGLADKAKQGSPNWRRHTSYYTQAVALFDGRARLPLVFTFDSAASADYSRLLQIPVETLPAVHAGAKSPGQRHKRNGKITVAFLGHQREDKGYHLLPEIVRNLQSHSLPIQILVHNSNQENDPISRELQQMAKSSPDLIFEHTSVDANYWHSLLERSDLLALPYEPARYLASYSAVAVEAVSAGIPLVAPAGTTMETLAQTYQAGATTFSNWNATEVAKAIDQAVTSFEELAQRSADAAIRWNDANGARPFVDRLLQLQSVEIKTRLKRPLGFAERAFNQALDAFFSFTMIAMKAARAPILGFRLLKSKVHRPAPQHH